MNLDDMLRRAKLKAHKDKMLVVADALRPASANITGMNILDATLFSGIVKSKGEARRFIASGALFANFKKVTDIGMVVEHDDLIHGFIIFRIGNEFAMIQEASWEKMEQLLK